MIESSTVERAHRVHEPDELSAQLRALQLPRTSSVAAAPRRWPVRWLAGALGAVALATTGARVLWRPALPVVSTVVVSESVLAPQSIGSAAGHVVARTRSQASAQSPARVVAVHAKRGQAVRRGDLLLELEHAEQASNRDALAARTLALRARASSLQIELRDAKERAQRQQRLFETGAVSANDAKSQTARAKSLASSAEAANADVRASQAELAALDTRIAERRIVAPTDGTLLNEPPHVGELFGGPGRMLELADFATLAIETEIPEAQLASVALGAPCEISLDALPTRQFRGEVSSIDPQVNRAKATIGLEVGFVGNTAGVLPNMAARVNFVRANAPTEPSKPRVAESAVLRLDARSYVFSVDEQDRLHRVEVELGATERGKVELLRGPPAGSAVVDHPSPALHDGQRVRYGE